MEKLRIKMAKFYQGVVVANNSNQTSVKAVYEKNVVTPRLVSIEHTPTGLMIITELETGESEHTLVPYNNVAYVNHELVPKKFKKDKEQEQQGKTDAMKPAADAAKASSESK